MQLEITDVRTLTCENPSVRKMELRDTPISVGAHSSNTVQLPDAHIAPYLAMLLPQGGLWIYEPKTRDGQATINGRPVHEKVELLDGDVIEIRHFSVKFISDAAPELVLPKPGNVRELARIRDYPLPAKSEVRKADQSISLDESRQKALGVFALELRSCTDYAQLLERTVELLLHELDARVAWMGIRRDAIGQLEFVHGRNDRGESASEPANIATFVYRCLERHQLIRIRRTGDGETQSVLALPLLGSRGALGLMYADTRRRKRVFDDADLDFAAMATRLVVPHLEALIGEGRDHRPHLETTELSLLRDVRAKLDPGRLPQWPQLQVAAFAKAGLDEAGDLHDVMRLPNGLAAVLIGRVVASPTRSAVAMAEVRSAFRMAGLHADPPHIQLKALRWLLQDEEDPCTLDIAVVVINPKTGVAEFCTTGAIGALITNPAGQPRSLADPRVPAVGTNDSHQYVAATERIREGETLVLFTPGCTVTRGEDGDAIGWERFVEAICRATGRPAGEAVDGFLADQGDYFQSGSSPADSTILLAHRVACG